MPTLGVSVAAIALFVVAIFVAFNAKGLETDWGVILKKTQSEDYALVLEKSRLGIRCHVISQEAGLTNREEEVLLLLLRKMNPEQIAKQLIIEVSTVRTHIKHIYAKLGVHSSKSLLGLVETEEKANPNDQQHFSPKKEVR